MGSSSEKEFVAEGEDLIGEAVDLLLNIQESPPGKADPQAVNALFRVMHTLKGMAGIYGHTGLMDVSHSLESLLDDVRMGKAALSSDVIDFLFMYTDTLKSIVAGTRGGRKKGKAPADEGIAGYIEEIRAFRESLGEKGEEVDLKGRIDGEVLKVLSEYEEHRLRSNVKEGNRILLLRKVFELGDFDVALKALTEKIKPLGEVVSTMPTSQDVPAGSIGFNIMVGTPLSPEEVKAAVDIEPEVLFDQVEKGGGEAPKAAPPVAGGLQARALESTLRVDIGKVDAILNTIEEISILKGSVKRIWAELVEAYGHTPLLIDLFRISQNTERLLSGLKQQVLGVRMVPIGQMFGRLAQAVRRYAREADKKINLEVYGQDTEIDKHLADEAMEPLVHLVRNAIDHGLERPDERAAAGKGPAGTVRLRAFQRGNNVVIEVEDDGRGIDLEKVRARAVEKGIFGQGEAKEERELLELLFSPGFSTRDAVSKVSGRGVGLDVVKERLYSLGASVGVATERGKGATFTLTLPITLAIMKSLVLRVGDETFAAPLSSIAETVAVEHGDLQSIEGKKVFSLRGVMVPAARLGDIIGIEGEDKERTFCVIAGSGERTVGFLVDELLEQHDLVIKPLGEYFEGMRGIAGAAEIGRHNVIMVLDVEALIDEFFRKKGAANV